MFKMKESVQTVDRKDKNFYRKRVVNSYIVVVLLAGIGYHRKYVANKFQWDELILSYVLPEPNSTYGNIKLNSDRYLSIDVF